MIDTNVVVSATLVRHGLPAAILNLVSVGAIVPVVSEDILAEYQEVLSRSRIRARPDRVRGVFQLLAEFAEKVESDTSPRVCADPDDDIFVGAAIAGGADILITGNIGDFPRRFQSVQAVTPREFMSIWERIEPFLRDPE